MTEPEALKARLADFIEQVWNQGLTQAADHFLAERYTIHHDPGDPWDGQSLDRAGFKARLAASRAPCPDQRFTPVDLIAEGRRVAMTWTWRATHLGEIGGIAPTGRVLTMSGATVYGFDAAGLITGHWQIADRLGIWRQLQAG